MRNKIIIAVLVAVLLWPVLALAAEEHAGPYAFGGLYFGDQPTLVLNRTRIGPGCYLDQDLRQRIYGTWAYPTWADRVVYEFAPWGLSQVIITCTDFQTPLLYLEFRFNPENIVTKEDKREQGKYGLLVKEPQGLVSCDLLMASDKSVTLKLNWMH